MKVRLPVLAAVGAIAFAVAPSAFAQGVNLGFEAASASDPAHPSGWSTGGAGYEFVLDTVAYEGSRSLRIASTGPGTFAAATQALAADSLRGLRLRLTGYIRTQEVTNGYAGLWLRIDGANRERLFLDNMNDRGATATGDWTEFSVEVVVPQAAAQIVFGVLLSGNGTAWVDELGLEYEQSAVPLEAPRALTDRGMENLIAFTQLLGFVRFFHPSDEAAAEDWDRFAVEGVRAVEGAQGPRQLAEVLDSLFQPIAPTMTVGVAIEPAPVVSVPPEAVEVVTWRHFGLGGPRSNIYRSDRIRTPLRDETLPDSIADPRDPLLLDLAGGIQAVLPIAAYADAQGTLPRSDSPPVPQTQSPAFTADDRATRLAAVAILWTSLQHFYPYFDVVSTSWNTELRGALRSAAEDRDQCEFNHTLQRMVAALHDGHGQVGGACAAPTAQPPVAVGWIEGRPTVTHVLEPSTQLQRGDVLLRIDGRTVEDILREEQEFISAATPQWGRVRLMQTLLAGPSGSTVEVTVERLSGETITLQLQRTRPGPVVGQRRGITEEIEPGIWYVAMDRISGPEFFSALPALVQASGIVFDLRGYPTSAAMEILRHLIDEPRTSPQWHVPVVTNPLQGPLRFDRLPGWNLLPADPYLSASKVFLTDGRAISYAESVMGIIEAYELATIVGQPTAGTNGNINVTGLPGGITVTWTGMKVLKHDGARHHGAGIVPDIPVELTRAGVAEGRDEVLERALEVLHSLRNP